ncbi:MAG: tetratricopeptide repeat protein, partial [Clostridia bacterium]|nr:tetratricopeptide repeat protein [Clostridia bacterium]
MASATPEEKSMISDAWHDLMWGYSDINPGRSLYFARRDLELCLQEQWLNQAFQAARMIGQHHWAAGQIDSAKAAFARAHAIVDRMALKEPLPGKPEGYRQETIDDAYSGLYGALGNLYASIDSIPQAMEYYRKCGELLEKNGWTESCSVLYQNMGETWLDAGELKEAQACYDKALRYGRAAEDSLLVAKAQAGLGALCLERGRTARALQLLKAADGYFSTHEDLEFRSRIYTLDLSGKVL